MRAWIDELNVPDAAIICMLCDREDGPPSCQWTETPDTYCVWQIAPVWLSQGIEVYHLNSQQPYRQMIAGTSQWPLSVPAWVYVDVDNVLGQGRPRIDMIEHMCEEPGLRLQLSYEFVR